MSKTIRIGHLNIYHLINRTPDVCNLLNNNPLTHIFGIYETKIHDPKTHTKTDTDNEDNDNGDFDILSLPNYSKPFFKHITQKLQTGLAVYIHNSIRHLVTRRNDIETNKVEAIWLEVKQPKMASKLLAYVYRNPSADTTIFLTWLIMLQKYLKTLQSFNLLKPNDKPQQHWSTITEQFGLTQFVDKPTRYDIRHDTWTLLDHIYSTDQHAIKNVEVSNSSISDHNPIFCNWNLKCCKPINKKHTTIEIRSFKNFNETSFLHDISLIDFNYIYNVDCPNEPFNFLNNCILTVLNKHAPKRKKRVKSENLPPWLTKEITTEMALRDYYKSKKCIDQYKKQRNKVSMLVRRAKQAHVKSFTENKRDTRQIWKALNEITNKKKTHTNQPPITLTPDELNNYFLTCPQKLLSSNYAADIEENSNLNLDDELKKCCNRKLKDTKSFTIPLLSVHEVGSLIYKLKNKNSVGSDEISIYVVKIILPYIIEHLTYAYNLSNKHNIFPSIFKAAKVITIPKSKDLTDPSSFRPISILPVLSKPLERHVHSHLQKHIETNALFMLSQSGFRLKHSCQTAVIKMCDAWLSALHRGETVGTVFLDFSKAFDVVNYSLLLKKLSLYIPNSEKKL